MSRSRTLVVCLYAAALAAVAGCHPTYVVVPPDPDAPQRQRVVVYDTVVVQDTVRVTQRLPGRPGSPTVVRVDTVLRTDTIFRNRTILRRDTVTVVRVDTVVRLAPGPGISRPRPDTVFRTDTLTVVRVDTVNRPVEVVRVDTLTVVRVDTVRLAATSGPKPRRLVLPPGHYPPPGQCRIWREGVPPGRQAEPGPCDQLGPVPPGAFILFAGVAWDFDYDWVALETAEPGSVPPEVVAVQKSGVAADAALTEGDAGRPTSTGTAARPARPRPRPGGGG